MFSQVIRADILLSPCGLGKIHSQLVKYQPVIPKKTSNKLYLLFHSCVILPYKGKRTRKICQRTYYTVARARTKNRAKMSQKLQETKEQN